MRSVIASRSSCSRGKSSARESSTAAATVPWDSSAQSFSGSVSVSLTGFDGSSENPA